MKQCYQCGHDNADQAFCGACGFPLALNDYISKKAKDALAETIKDRDVLEMDSSIKVFKEAWGWIKLIIGIAAGLLILAGGGVFWKVSDFWSGVDTAKQSVANSAKKSSDDIAHMSSQSKRDISDALDAAKKTINTASHEAVQKNQALKETTLQTQAEISRQTASFRKDLEGSRAQLQAANKIQPEMEVMQKQLTQATHEIEAQQRVISSSEEFAKSIFSSHVVEFFHIGQPPNDRYAVLSPPKGGNRTVLFLLLQSVPIPETLQLQYHIYTQPQNSYGSVQNLVMFFWADPPDNLKAQQLSVSYFPDKSNKDIIHSLSQHDGRVFADDQPLPKLNQVDPEFKGNRWFTVEGDLIKRPLNIPSQPPMPKAVKP